MMSLFKQFNPYLARLSVVILLVMFINSSVLAVGTGAGVNINNTATASYSRGGNNFIVNSNTTSFLVDEKLDVSSIRTFLRQVGNGVLDDPAIDPGHQAKSFR